MHIEVNQRNGVTVLTLSGRMNAITAQSFDERCRELLDQGVTRMVVDLGGIAYMSSAGLRSILTLQKCGQCTLSFCAPQPMVVDIFRISGFNRILTIYATLDEALARAAD